MSATFRLDRTRGMLFNAAGQCFDAVQRSWQSPDTKARATDPLEAVDAIVAATWLQRESAHPLRVPIGVIGPREASDAQCAVALEVGELLSHCGFYVVCGGRQGVMQADGRMAMEARMNADDVGRAVVYMANLPLDTNVLFMTVMANLMPFVGRG